YHLNSPPLDLLQELRVFPYNFNVRGELRHLDTNDPFVFNYYKNTHEKNHERYQVLGRMITQYVYELLERVCTLQKVYIPSDATEDEPRSFFFMSEKALTSSSSIIVLLQDRGVFHAGQWGQKTIIREGLYHGTQIPFIKMCIKGQFWNTRSMQICNFKSNKISEATQSEPLGLYARNLQLSD
uniref:Arb2 domain-containing protein n=1 Tax=Coturnix japonica TaxID=93934 RepID=A0A8C2U1R3_COTJA